MGAHELKVTLPSMRSVKKVKNHYTIKVGTWIRSIRLSKIKLRLMNPNMRSSSRLNTEAKMKDLVYFRKEAGRTSLQYGA